MVARMSLQGMGSPFTSSMGRLFDAVAAICGVRLEVSYEGQAAVEFEALADRAAADPYPLEFEHRSQAVALDPRPMIRAVLDDIAAGVPVSTISARFHAGLARATAEVLVIVAERQDLQLAVLSGGVFQNRLLLELTLDALEAAGLRVLVPREAAAQRRADRVRAGRGRRGAARGRLKSPAAATYALRHGRLRAERALERLDEPRRHGRRPPAPRSRRGRWIRSSAR